MTATTTAHGIQAAVRAALLIGLLGALALLGHGARAETRPGGIIGVNAPTVAESLGAPV